MLVGKELLDKARSLSNRPEEDIARGCGYVGASGRLLKKSFYRALVEAKAKAQNWQLPKNTNSSATGTRGRQAEFRTRVHGNGNLLIGHAYTRQLGLEPGQEFRIELQEDDGSILLLQIDQDQP
ncbi:AbrB family transcriptional regulator [Synechococcus sp. M16CYN]|uniref:AbrB family transcriptional regulator n=1 Tax=Synechococcus sp. M16CYN TaxID=3103139 RepID=UPI0032444703